MSSKNPTKVNNSDFVSRFVEIMETGKPAEIGRKLGIDYQSAKNYLGGRKPSADVLETIAEKTNVSLNWLLTGGGEKYVNQAAGAGEPSDENTKFTTKINQGDLDLNVFLEEKIRGIVKEELKTFSAAGQAVATVQEITQIVYTDEHSQFDLSNAIEKYDTLEDTLEAWFAHEGKPMPEGFGLNFSGWKNLTLEDKIYTVKQIKETIDNLNKEIDTGTFDYE